MYETPVTLVEQMTRDYFSQVDKYVFEQIMPIVKVEKEELIKALKYDRNQYYKGYEDGKKDAVTHGHWIEHKDEPRETLFIGIDEPPKREWKISTWTECSACEQIQQGYFVTPYCPHCGARMDGKDIDEEE